MGRRFRPVHYTSVIVALLFGGSASSVAGQSASAQGPDHIYVNGTILTPQGQREAMAVKDGLIVAVGSSDDIKNVADVRTQVTDLGGKTVMPGLYDMHVHIYFAGRSMLSCSFP